MQGFLHTIILLGALQGFILSGLLFFSANRPRPNRLLALLIFLLSLACLKLYGLQQGWFEAYPLLHTAELFIPMIVIMPIGPLLLFYVKSSLDPDFRVTARNRAQFYPVIIDLVPQGAVLLFFAGVSVHAIKNDPAPWGYFIDTYNVYSDIPRWVSMTAYACMAARHLSDPTSRAGLKPGQNASPGLPEGTRTWLRQLVRAFLIFQAIWLLYLVPYIIPRYTDPLLTWIDWYPVYVPLAVLIYWLGIRGLLCLIVPFPSKKR